MGRVKKIKSKNSHAPPNSYRTLLLIMAITEITNSEVPTIGRMDVVLFVEQTLQFC